MVIWLKILHNSDLQTSYDDQNLRIIWELLAAGLKYGFDPHKAKTWFRTWYSQNQTYIGQQSVRYHQALLFPCHALDHAVGFAASTKYLVYHEKGHIQERRPDGFYMDILRLDQAIIGMENLCIIQCTHLY